MKHSECAMVLTTIGIFDGRWGPPTPPRVEAWMELDVIKRNDLQTVLAAVKLFYDQEPLPNGQSPFLDPHQLRRFVRLAKAAADRTRSVASAREASDRALGQGPGTEVSRVPAPDCQHRSVGISEGGGLKTWTCNACTAVLKEEPL